MTSRAYEMSQSFDHDGDVTITGNTTILGDLSFDGTGFLRIPAGTTSQRPEVGALENGMIRYNTTVNKYEGYHENEWLNFNDLRDKDNDTKITVHEGWGNDEDELKFYTGDNSPGAERLLINTTAITSTTITNTMTASHVEIAAAHTVITGNLTVQGDQTIVQSGTVAVVDKVIELSNAEIKTASTAHGAGIMVNDGAADHNILWNNAGRWDISNNAKVAGDLEVGGNDLSFGNGESVDNNTNGKLKFNAADGVILSGNKILNSEGTDTLTLDDNEMLTVAGNLQVDGNNIRSSTNQAITLDGEDVTVNGDLTVSGNDINSSTGHAITLDEADVAVKGDLTVEGDDIHSSSGHAISLSEQDVTIQGNLIAGNNRIDSSTGHAFALSGADVTVKGDLTVEGDDIHSSTGHAISLSGTNVIVKGDLVVAGNEIQHTDGTTDTTVLTLASDNVTAEKGLTIPATENFTFGGQTFTGSARFQIKDSAGEAVLDGYLLTT